MDIGGLHIENYKSSSVSKLLRNNCVIEQKASTKDIPLENSKTISFPSLSSNIGIGYDFISISSNSVIFSELLIRKFLEKIYSNSDSNVFDFVRRNDIIIDALYKAPLIISNYFTNPKLVLEFHYDVEENTETLFLFIKTSLSRKDSSKIMRNIFKEWDMLKNSSVNKLLTISAIGNEF